MQPSPKMQRERLTLHHRCDRGWLCLADERELSEVGIKDGVVELDIAPYKIVTIKVRPC